MLKHWTKLCSCDKTIANLKTKVEKKTKLENNKPRKSNKLKKRDEHVNETITTAAAAAKTVHFSE